jgi:Fe-S cluster biogenesis protein NfuA/nitrite reductase/ring-hydroxylating ferredoxin subunit
LGDQTEVDRIARVEALLEGLEGDDGPARERALEVARALLDLYGEGMERLVEHIAAHDEGGEIAAAVADDELVSHLLLVHGLHPVPLEARVRGALDGVRPYLESHGGNVEVLGIEDATVHLRLEGSCSGCPSSTVTLKLAIEDAIRKAAPDVEEIRAEGATESGAPAPQLIQLEVPDQWDPAPAATPVEGSWAMAGGLPELAATGGGPLVKEVGGEELLFLRVGEQTYAYRPACPGCGESLAGAEVEGIALACPACGNRYDVMRAGRCMDVPDLHLDPVPLLVDESGLVKVAVGAAA